MPEDKKFDLKIVTPDRVFYEGRAGFVEFNTTEGEIGVYKDHVPTTVIVSPGILNIYEEDMNANPKKAALHGGFVTILQDKITIMAEVIEWPTEIDGDRALQAKERAEERIKVAAPETDMLRAEMALKRSLTRINLIKK